MKAPPLDAHPARFSALPTRFSRATPVYRKWRVREDVGGGFPELAEPRLVDRAELRANHLRQRIAPREGAAVSPLCELRREGNVGR